MRLLATGVVLLAVLAGAVGCATSEESAPSPAPTPSASSPAPTSALPSTILPTGSAGSDGLTVRYRDDDGTLKTVRVEDFPR